MQGENSKRLTTEEEGKAGNGTFDNPDGIRTVNYRKERGTT